MPRNFKKLIADIRASKLPSERGNVILYLHKPRLSQFKRLCKENGTSPSKIIDSWIEETLEEAKKKK